MNSDQTLVAWGFIFLIALVVLHLYKPYLDAILFNSPSSGPLNPSNFSLGGLLGGSGGLIGQGLSNSPIFPFNLL